MLFLLPSPCKGLLTHHVDILQFNMSALVGKYLCYPVNVNGPGGWLLCNVIFVSKWRQSITWGFIYKYRLLYFRLSIGDQDCVALGSSFDRVNHKCA